MSINENQEFESINQKTGERRFIAETECQCKEEYNRLHKDKAKKRAIGLLVVKTIAFIVAAFGITGLELIGWINSAFHIVLLVAAGSVAMFNAGYLWHEIKN